MTTEQRNYSILSECYEKIEILISQKVTARSAEFVVWSNGVTRALSKIYGKDSLEVKLFSKKHFSLNIYFSNTLESEFINACKEGLIETKMEFDKYLKELKSDLDDSLPEPIKALSNYHEVFIVHGHDNGLKQEVARVLEKQGIVPIILHEQPNQGQTIIEKLEHNGNVGAAVILMTPDDKGCEISIEESKPRARQNVIYEAGYFAGRLGRKNVIFIGGEVETPSDLQGVIYTNSKDWIVELLKELKSIGYEIDFNKMYK